MGTRILVIEPLALPPTGLPQWEAECENVGGEVCLPRGQPGLVPFDAEGRGIIFWQTLLCFSITEISKSAVYFLLSSVS